jgi:Domain of unknown function (DUF1877)
MSMTGSLRTLTPRLYQQLRHDGAAMARITGPAGGDDERLAPELLAHLPEPTRSRLIAQQDAPPIAAGELGATLELDKAWHALHFLVAGSIEVPSTGAGACILGGDPCGADLGYGPARLHGPAAVAAIASALPTSSVLRGRFDPDALARAQVYPGVWSKPADDLWEWLGEVYSELVDFYRDAASRGHAMALWLS